MAARRKGRPRPPAEDLPIWLLESLRSPSGDHPDLSPPIRERLAELATKARAAVTTSWPRPRRPCLADRPALTPGLNGGGTGAGRPRRRGRCTSAPKVGWWPGR